MGGAWITTRAIGPDPPPNPCPGWADRSLAAASSRVAAAFFCLGNAHLSAHQERSRGAVPRYSALVSRPSLPGPRYPTLARSLPIDDRASGAALTPYCQLGRPVRARRWVEAGAISAASVPMIEAGSPVLPATPGKAREGKPNSQRSGTCRCAHRGNFLLLAEFGLIFALALAQMACRLIDLAAS